MAKQDPKYIGNYKILDIIGKGGMARIYTAIHVPLDRIVVIKEMARNESRRRFKNEAVICSKLEHKNIVPLYDYFTAGNSCYIVMQYVDGQDLAVVIEKEAPLHPTTAATIAYEICSALACAHRSNIIHRDIKPTNVLISRQGEVKITDFGVARGEDMPHLTSTGTVIGTPFYMSPEQASGKELKRQSDIYSLGIVLYEMLTGKKPFSGENTAAVTAKIVRGKYASPFFSDPHHSYGLSRIIRKAMSKNVNRRYATAEHLCEDLQKFVGWKKIAQSERMLCDLLENIEASQRATTIIQEPAKKKKKRKKGKKTGGHRFYVYAILLVILVFLMYYLFKLLTS